MKVRGMCIAVLVTTLLSACDNSSADTVSQSVKVQDKPQSKTQDKAQVAPVLLSFPALPIIQNSLKSLSPTLNAQFDLSMIQKVCLLARGEISKEAIAQALKQDGIDTKKIPSQGAPLSLLVNDDQSGRQVLCAAWIASSIAAPLDSKEITEEQVREVKEKGKVHQVGVNVIVNSKLQQALATKMAIARANAEFYGVIATELASHPGRTLEDYTVMVKKQFSILAPVYLKRIQELYSPSENGYQLTSLNKGEYRFSTDGGYNFSYDQNGVLLTYNGINWLGKGEVLGKKYEVEVNYLSPQIVSALQSL